MTTAIRFKYGSTNVDFYDDEINELKLNYIVNRKIFVNNSNYYIIHRIGLDESKYKIFDIDFNIHYGNTNGTLAKIDTLYAQVTDGQPDILYFYWKYYISTTTMIPVKMIRQNMAWKYSNGSETAKYSLPISFIECKTEGVGMLYSPMITLLGNGS